MPCTFVLMALCIYEHSLFLMHLYPCGRTLNIYATVINRSSNLSWMISEWFCWSWNMHRLVSIYLHTHLFYCFCLKELLNVNLKMKRDIELQKPIAHTNIWLGKKESDLKQKVGCPKSQRLAHHLKCQKFQASISQWDVLIQKDQMIWYIWSQLKSFASYVIKFCGRSYMHISIIEMGHFT